MSKKKQLKRQISLLSYRIRELERKTRDCEHCENYKPKTVEFRRWRSLSELTAQAEEQKSNTEEC